MTTVAKISKDNRGPGKQPGPLFFVRNVFCDVKWKYTKITEWKNSPQRGFLGCERLPIMVLIPTRLIEVYETEQCPRQINPISHQRCDGSEPI